VQERFVPLFQGGHDVLLDSLLLTPTEEVKVGIHKCPLVMFEVIFCWTVPMSSAVCFSDRADVSQSSL
jgi:hypothetical protein